MLLLQCTACFIILLLAGGSFIAFIGNERYAAVKTELEEKAEYLSQRAKAGTVTENTIANASISFEGYMVQLVTGEEARSFFTETFWDKYAGQAKEKTQLAKVLRSAGEEWSFTSHYFGGLFSEVLSLYCVIPGDTAQLLLVHADMRSCNASLRAMAGWLGISLLISLILVCLVNLYTANTIIKPITSMNHFVQCYSKGDFSRRLPVTGRDEASQLARSFNEMAEQLHDMDNTRKSFVANVSHELRSPLTSIKGFLEAMKDGTIPPEEHEAYLDIVLSETRRMTSMLNDLLDLARIESGIITVTYKTFDINELIRRILITFEARISEKKLALEVKFSHDECYVNADANQISQVLRNLIDNAIKYSPEGRSLSVSTYPLRKEVYVIIKDTGIGIPSEDVPHVFDRFYKVEKAHTPSPQVGSGLGLSIVKKIIEAHGQSITVKSARGKGTQFTFTLEKASLLQIQTRGRTL